MKPVRTLTVLGSGGHTAEMMALLSQLNKTIYNPRFYVIADTDRMGRTKAQAAEQLWDPTGADESGSAARVFSIPRSREVGQSYLTSVWTTLVAFLAAARLVFKLQPDLVLVNGPGTCIPLCVAAVIRRSLGLGRVRIVYVESIARVRSLSLSGSILYRARLADAFFVQWPALQHQFPRSLCTGRLF